MNKQSLIPLKEEFDAFNEKILKSFSFGELKALKNNTAICFKFNPLDPNFEVALYTNNLFYWINTVGRKADALSILEWVVKTERKYPLSSFTYAEWLSEFMKETPIFDRYQQIVTEDGSVKYHSHSYFKMIKKGELDAPEKDREFALNSTNDLPDYPEGFLNSITSFISSKFHV